ncbi:hypothetical protein [Azospirillum sp.]|uniref:hypothetical protein n=1 Tax=Azospirillum sp. TaxID=34012 RepID=UPI003D7359CF
MTPPKPLTAAQAALMERIAAGSDGWADMRLVLRLVLLELVELGVDGLELTEAGCVLLLQYRRWSTSLAGIPACALCSA